MPTTHLLTARLTPGQKVQITRLHNKPSSSSSSSPSGLPLLQDIREAGIIQLKEISSVVLASPTSAPERKQRDWLRLLLRESLGFLLFYMRVFATYERHLYI